MRSTTFLIFIVALFIVTACSGSSSKNPIQPTPDQTNNDPVQTLSQDVITDNGHHFLWGYWNICISEDRQSAEIIPMRTLEYHFNMVNILQIFDAIVLDNFFITLPNLITFDIALMNPYWQDKYYTGFDVRGTIMSDGDYSFPANEQTIAWGENTVYLMNSDGYSRLFNPIHFSEAGVPILEYFQGNFSPPGYTPTSTINPYMAYFKEDPRRMFPTGVGGKKTFELRVPDIGGVLMLGYAVDASWDVPTVVPVVNPYTDFPPEANSIEAWQIDAKLSPMPDTGMFGALMEVKVWDFQGPPVVDTITVEAPELFDGTWDLTATGDIGPDWRDYSGYIENVHVAPVGIYPMLVRVEDPALDDNLGQVDSWAVAQVRVAHPLGWALTWGGNGEDRIHASVTDPFGNVYFGGCYQSDTIDLDPGPGVDEHVLQSGIEDAFLIKVDQDGQFQWAMSYDRGGKERIVELTYSNGLIYAFSNKDWIFPVLLIIDAETHNIIKEVQWILNPLQGLMDPDNMSMVHDSDGNLCVASAFWGTIDIDPGPGVVNITTGNFATDALLFKLDPLGNFIWAVSWGDELSQHTSDIILHPEGLLVISGRSKLPDNSHDGFVRVCEPDGDFLIEQWWVTLGDDRIDSLAGGISDLIFCAGKYDGKVSVTMEIIGAPPIWRRIWGDTGIFSQGIATDLQNNAHVAIAFDQTFDADPGPGFQPYTPNGITDSIILKLNDAGELITTRHLGPCFMTIPFGLENDLEGNIYTYGVFTHLNGTDDLDFGPEPWVDYHRHYPDISGFLPDCYLIKYNSGLAW